MSDDTTSALTRICRRCRLIKPLTAEYFHHSASDKTGYFRVCKLCKKELAKAEYQRNKTTYERYREDNAKHIHEYMVAYRPAYYEKNKIKIIAQVTGWQKTNKDRVNTKQRCLYHKDIDGSREYTRAKARRHRKQNPQKFRVIGQRRRSQMRELITTFTVENWRSALDYWNGTCAYCGNSPSLFDHNPILHQDHFIPVTADGNYSPDNILPACQSCNISKSDREASVWLNSRFGPRKAKIILAHIQAYFDSLKDPG